MTAVARIGTAVFLVLALAALALKSAGIVVLVTLGAMLIASVLGINAAYHAGHEKALLIAAALVVLVLTLAAQSLIAVAFGTLTLTGAFGWLKVAGLKVWMARTPSPPVGVPAE